MNGRKTAAMLIGLLAVTLGFAGVAGAKGAMPVRISAEGDVIIDVTDPEDYAAIDLFAMMDFAGGEVTPPTELGTGYLMERYWPDESGEPQTFDQATFYFDPAGDARGWVYYDGIHEGWSEYDGKWFRAGRAGTEAMRALLDDQYVLAADPPAPVGSAPLFVGAIAALLGIGTAAAGQHTRRPASD